MADNLSNWAENATMDWLMGGASPTRPTARYVGLHTGDPGETGAANEIVGDGYAREVSTFGASSLGTSSNSMDLTFTASGGAWGTVSHLSVRDAVSGGNCLWHGPLVASKVIADGDSLFIATGDLDLTLS